MAFLFVFYLVLLTAFVGAQVKLETALPIIPQQPPPGAGLPQYINYLFIFGLGLIIILALTQMIIGGIMYILAAGNAAKVEDAKDMILQAIFGIGVLLISFLFLRTINPDLVNLRNPNLTPVQFQFPNPGLPSRSGTSCSPNDPAPNCFSCVSGIWTRMCNPNL